MASSNRKNYIVVLCPAEFDPQTVAEKHLIYREVWLSLAEAQQLAEQIKYCKGLSGYRIKPGPDTLRAQKGPGDLPRILTRLNGGVMPKGPSQRSILEALYGGRTIHELLPKDDALRPVRPRMAAAGLLAATALAMSYANDRAPWPNTLVPQLGV